ncbi:MAG: nucleotide exchange factor GrpE [Muribaculaceae bacterium]
MGLFGKTESERETDLINQVKALQDSVELQRRIAADAEAAVKAKDEELRAAYSELQAIQKEVADMQKKLADGDEKSTNVYKEIESIKASLAERDAKIASLEHALAEKDAQIASMKETQQKPVEEQKPVEVPVVAAQPAVDYTPQFEAIKAQMADLKESYGDLVRKDDLFNSMHKELDTLRNDVYNKLTRPYKVSIISLYDSIMRTYNYYSSHKEEEGSYDRLLKQLDNFIMSIVDMLCDEYNLDSYDAKEGEPFDRRAHKTMDVVETDDPAKHGTVAKALQCGFKYTAYDPVKGIEREVIFRPAFVDTYKLKQQQ